MFHHIGRHWGTFRSCSNSGPGRSSHLIRTMAYLSASACLERVSTRTHSSLRFCRKLNYSSSSNRPCMWCHCASHFEMLDMMRLLLMMHWIYWVNFTTFTCIEQFFLLAIYDTSTQEASNFFLTLNTKNLTTFRKQAFSESLWLASSACVSLEVDMFFIPLNEKWEF